MLPTDLTCFPCSAPAEIPGLPTQQDGLLLSPLEVLLRKTQLNPSLLAASQERLSTSHVKELSPARMMAWLQVLKAICGHRSPSHHQSGQDSEHQPPLPQQVRTTWSSHTTNISTRCERGLQAKIFSKNVVGQAKVPSAVKAHEAAEQTQNRPGEVTHSLDFCPQRSSLTHHEKPVTFPACGST